jgi:hypothetical protein
MKTKFEIPIYKVVLLFFAGFVAGGALALVLTNNMPLLGGSLLIISMILVSIVILISVRKNGKVQ